MTNQHQHGDFIWYELITSDVDAAQAFYEAVLGWSFADSGMPDMDYRLFSAGEGPVGGAMKAPEGAPMPPAWLGYVGVDDVDKMAESVAHGGGAVHMEPQDIPGVGRFAFVADPQGAAFYVMRGASDEPSQSFAADRPRVGHCAWNELATTDPAAALHFYGSRFGWVKDGEMPMGEAGDEAGAYEFLRHGKVMIGAVMPKPAEMPASGWTYYFRVADIDAAVAAITANGGRLLYDPMEIPGGDYALAGVDPQGAVFALVGARSQAS